MRDSVYVKVRKGVERRARGKEKARLDFVLNTYAYAVSCMRYEVVCAYVYSHACARARAWCDAFVVRWCV